MTMQSDLALMHANGATFAQVLDAHAHLLAEQQRHYFGVRGAPVRAHCDPDCDYCQGVTSAADLIDPETSDD